RWQLHQRTSGCVGRSFCPEEAVPGIAEAWENVAHGIELTIVRGCVHRNIGMCGGECSDPLRRGDQADEGKVAGPGLFQLGGGGDRRPTGGEHRVEEEETMVRCRSRHLEIVRYGLECLVIPVEADVPDPGIGDQLNDPVDHPETGTENRNEGDLATDPVACGALQWS